MAAGKDRSPCARCAQTLGRSCCQPGPGERLATLTATDVERIRTATGWRRERFVEHEPLASEEALAYEERRPGYRGYFRTTTVRWGLRAERGACVFLVGARVHAPPGTRPTACLLYPFEPADHGWTLAVERSAPSTSRPGAASRDASRPRRPGAGEASSAASRSMSRA